MFGCAGCYLSPQRFREGGIVAKGQGKTNTPRKLLRRKRVKELCGDPSNSSMWRWIKAGTFPAPVQIGEGSVAWWEDEILAWQQSRIRAGGKHIRGHGPQRDDATADAAE